MIDKMLAEKLSEEYAATHKTEWENDTYWVDCYDEITDAFIAGFEKALEIVLSEIAEDK